MATRQTEAAADAAAGARSGWPRRPIYYGYWLVVAGFIAQFVSVGSQNYVIGVFLKPMTEELDWTRAEYTLSRTLGQFVMAFTGLMVGAYVDRKGGRRLMIIGATVLGASLFALSFVQSLWQWWLLNGIALTAGAALIGNLVVNVTISKWFVEKRGRMVGLASMGVSFAGVALPPVVTAIVDEFGWRAGWRVLAVWAVAMIYPVSLLMRRAPEDHGLHPDGKSDAQVRAGQGRAAAADFANSLTRGEALRTKSFYLLVIAFGMFGLLISTMLLQTIPFMTDAGYSRATASWMITLTSIPALLSKPIWGIFIDRAEPKRLAMFGSTITAVALTSLIYAVNRHIDPLVYIGFFLLGVGWGGQIPLQEVIWASYFGRRYLGAVRSAGLPLALAFSAGGPLLTSLYFDRVGDYNGALLTVAAFSFVSGILVLFVRRPNRRTAPAG
jgi:MFS transporter, OFA family, oxalate/formate antiporter